MEELRKCTADGKPAYFHQWINVDDIIYTSNTRVKTDVEKIKTFISEIHPIVPVYLDITVCKKVFALVEYEDGQVAKVDPEKVRFVKDEIRSNELEKLQSFLKQEELNADIRFNLIRDRYDMIFEDDIITGSFVIKTNIKLTDDEEQFIRGYFESCGNKQHIMFKWRVK